VRVVHVSPFYHPVIGGVEHVTRIIAEYLVQRGFEVYVVTYNRLRSGYMGALPEKEERNGVKVIRLKPTVVYSHGSYSPRLVDVIKELKPDLVHVHVWRHPHVFQIALLKERLKFKALLSTHGPFHTLKQVGLLTWIYHRLVDSTPLSRLVSRYDKILVLTPIEKAIWTRMGFRDEVLKVVPNFIDDMLLRYAYKTQNHDNKENIVLYLGRISRDKNANLLLNIARYLCEYLPDAKIVFAGPVEPRLYRKLMDVLRKSNCTSYIGAVSFDEKINILRKAKIFVNTVLWESFGIALLEAQAFGIPCVITGFGGQLYVAPPGISSIWVKPNVKSFLSGIKLLLFDRQLYRKLQQGALRWHRRFTPDSILPVYVRLYEELLQS